MADLANPDQPKLGAAAAENFLARVDSLVDWTAVDTVAAGSEQTAAASVPLFALKISLLKDWYGLSDAEAQGRMLDRLSFRAFIGFAGDGGPNDLAILNELNYCSWSRGSAMAGALLEVEQQLRRQGYSVRAVELREPSLMPCTESGIDRPQGGSTSLFDPGELGRMLEAVTAKAHAEGKDLAGPLDVRIASAEIPETAAASAGLAVPDEPSRIRAVLEWPWGRTELTEHLNIGRDHAFSPLAQELTPYTHVSRKHAELLVYGEGVWIRDLGSRNGTYVNGDEVPKGQAYLIDGDAMLRFGPALAVSLKIYD